jgi:hypothetical protein
MQINCQYRANQLSILCKYIINIMQINFNAYKMKTINIKMAALSYIPPGHSGTGQVQKNGAKVCVKCSGIECTTGREYSRQRTIIMTI